MCGIAGWFGGDAGLDAVALQQALHHRGPDGSGLWEGEKVTLVHTRLAILDLTEAGKQPMEYRSPDSPSRRGVLVFNGEIYNFRELRAELESQGESFTGESDTEVLLRLLVREGVAALPRLAGMFAFAFWDESRGVALLARDPLGIKPLYYREEKGTLAFASETRVLGKAGDTKDAGALRDFFLWGSVPEPATLNQRVRQLPAGHCLMWKDGKATVSPWGPSGGQNVYRGNPAYTKEVAASVTRVAMIESLERHLVSDVPVGIFLSGGIDSTAILALTREVLGPHADIRTFSIGFEEAAFDESAPARRTAECFGACHTEWKMTTEDGAAEIPAFLEAMDQPTNDGFNTWCVSKLARREGVKVVLSGLGGDEIFAGYPSFGRVPQFRTWHERLGPLRSLAALVLKAWPAGTPHQRLAAFLRGGGSWLEAYHAQRGFFTPEEAALLATAFCSGPPGPLVWDRKGWPTDPRDVVSELEVTGYMRNQLLRDSDVFSMAHGLELRVPLVDQRFLEVIRQIPAGIRLRQGKQLLLEAVPEVPDWVRNQVKRGFRFPFQQWMEGGFGEFLQEARRRSPVPLNTWYRTWVVAAALRVLENR